jgi:hypothetical protein
MIRDVRDHDPIAVQVGAADLPDAAQFLALHGTELGEVDLRPRQQAQCLAAAGRGWFAARSLGRRLALHHGLGKRLNVFLRDAALGAGALHLFQRHAEFARELAH